MKVKSAEPEALHFLLLFIIIIIRLIWHMDDGLEAFGCELNDVVIDEVIGVIVLHSNVVVAGKPDTALDIIRDLLEKIGEGVYRKTALTEEVVLSVSRK